MRLRLGVTLACFISLIWIQHILCDEVLASLDINKWTCTCHTSKLNQQSAIATNCSSSCDCSYEGPRQNRWKCVCNGDRLPKVAADRESGCFVSCNCNSGLLSEGESSKKQFSSKSLLIILLLSMLVATLAIFASVMCYVYRKHICPKQIHLSSSDKDTSFSSTTNLISYKTASVPESKIYMHSPNNPITGCIYKASYFFKKQTRTVHGTIASFSYNDLETATNKFSDSNLIGVGVSSHVYYGQLRDGKLVAVKRLKSHGGPDAEVTFLTEIELLSRLHHCHVVPLLGYCLEYHGKHLEMLLIFEYMTNGNLRECLDGISEKCLDWGARIVVAIGAARGLEYLHEAAAPRILHRDVKSSNILLDQNWRAKITDLGMAKSLVSDGLPSCSSSPARMQGTFGYFAPEYAIVGRASLMSDVFSFGVVLLELISGRHPIYKSPDKGEESLVIWATPLLQDSKRVSKELPDPRLKGNFEEEELQVMAYLAKECLLLDPDARPTMSEVVQILLTIAPEKSKRRNFSIDHHQDYTIRMDRATEQQTSSSRSYSSESSLLMHTQEKNNDDESAIDSPKNLDQGIYQTLESSHVDHDETTVDLTEPRFESFCVLNLSSDT
uniref:receptor-like serine/threonine-protein kinase NCRK isoform X2 n=1 Tax=Erigeron canadensis TaxID=72917 RepID=UPI001CB9CE11|nr:receptor-like serine/threonine-protein kinase NCRK isoform X2 [Erigeron canadensis]